MAKKHFYLLCILPGLDSLGNIPPVNKQELLSLVRESGGPVEVVQTMLLRDDLLQKEAVLSGQIEPEQAELAVLSLQQVKDEELMPDFMITEQGDEMETAVNPIPADRMWRRYFHHTAEVAQVARSPFLRAWAGFEVGLRNALAKTRAEALELKPGPYLVAPELGDTEFHFDDILISWTSASNPLEALEVLDRARWQWITEHEPWYHFNDNEVAAYTAKLMILHRSQRITAGGIDGMLS